jgi:hypothetical protein
MPPRKRAGFPTFPPHMSARCEARLFILFWVFVSLSGLIPESGIHGDSDTNARRVYRNTRFARVTIALRSWRPFRPSCSSEQWTGRRQTRINSRASGDDGQFGGRFSIPHRREQFNRATHPDSLRSIARRPSSITRGGSRRTTRAHAPSTHTGTLQYPEAAPGVAYASTRGTSYPCTSSHAARKDRRARCRS